MIIDYRDVLIEIYNRTQDNQHLFNTRDRKMLDKLLDWEDNEYAEIDDEL